MADAASAGRERVLVRRVTDLGTVVETALDFLRFDFAGKRVWVKPNLLGPHPPERAVTTDPELVGLVVRGLRARGAADIAVADNPAGGMHGNIASYVERTGVPQASDGCFRDISATPVRLELNSRFTDAVFVSRILVECDVILNLPVMKTHALTILTGAVKNLFGIIPGAQKGRLHVLAPDPVDFAELLVDIYQAVPVPVLSIVDAIRGMDGQNGPNAGRVLALNRLIAGSNPVAVDSVLARLAGIAPAEVPLLRIAAERGLGPIAADAIDVFGDAGPIRGFRLPLRLGPGPVPRIIRAFYALSSRRPVVTKRRCTRCRRCADNCPAGAIVMSPYPRLDRRNCIKCFCCAEICPEHAMLVPGNWTALYQNLLGR